MRATTQYNPGMVPDRICLFLVLLLSSSGWAVADKPTAESYQVYLAAAERHLSRENSQRARRSYMQALDVKPSGIEALIGLARISRGPERGILLRQALLHQPTNKAVHKELGGKLPTILKKGQAKRLEATYLGHCRRATGVGKTPSLEVGQTVRRELLIVHGLDGDGNLVPIDPEIGGERGLSQDLLAQRASARAAIIVRDRNSGASVKVPLRLIGPTEKLRLWSRNTRVGTNEMLHLAAGLYDAAGNRVWVPRLEWRIVDGDKQARPTLLKRAVSQVHRDITFEPHRNIVLGPTKKSAYLGPLTVTVVDPISKQQDVFQLTRVAGRVISKASKSGLSWASSFETALADAAKRKRPMLVLFYADW